MSTIINAFYGGDTIKAVDVTSKVQSKITGQSGAIQIPVTLTDLGITVDPALNVRKSLSVCYLSDSSKKMKIVSAVDGGNVNINVSDINSTLGVLSATYSSNNFSLDITSKMNDILAQTGSIHKVGSTDFLGDFCNGADPDSGVAKTLTLLFFKDGEFITTNTNDGQMVNFNPADPTT